ncbi:phage holin family protein [Oscillatoriales cyanobacterium LEGE 11467]|uniref:Phage holin family protein n=1 Tax=Zarconia navalis LEGE 11467 TaxID=1828826 RepID=A0A928VUA6_9CYAN|nr:phage holin family protein [Zarconia navalis]MBE9039569.1 phage holin family protein [Zarconia navalis LEGE 11467]
MIGYFLTWLATALSLLVVDIIVPGVSINTFSAALLAAVAIGLVNSFVKPVISTLSLPINILSLGLFSLVVNGLCLWLASVFVPGFAVRGILGIILGPVILSAVNTFLSNYLVERSIALNLTGSSELSKE